MQIQTEGEREGMDGREGEGEGGGTHLEENDFCDQEVLIVFICTIIL